MVDFHSHFLHNIDDGSSSIHETIRMLKYMREQHIDAVIATPHFYPVRISIDQFLSRRERAVDELLAETKFDDKIGIKFILGAEVAYYSGISLNERIEDLCIKGTKYLLLELPYCAWTDSMFNEVFQLSQKGVTPIIAHVERYHRFHDVAALAERLKDNKALIQVNADFFTGFFNRTKAIKMFDNYLIDLIGSDSHNMTNRSPNLGQALEYIKGKVSEERFLRMTDLQDKILENAQGDFFEI